MTIDNLPSNKRTLARSSPALIPVPSRLALLMRLVNLLPESLRRSAGMGFHELTQGTWELDSDEEALNAWFYFWRHVNKLPIDLQAFVLHDEDGLIVEKDHVRATRFDLRNLQPYENIKLPGQPESELQRVLSTATERLKREMEIAEKKAALRQNEPSLRGDSASRLVGIPSGPEEYEIRESTFSAVGPRHLLSRARQRFFFLLAAEEILDALVDAHPQNKLDGARYVERSGALRGSLFVKDDRVHLYPPVLFDFVVGQQVSRIRKCNVCGNYFWAGRKDKTVCSEACGATKRKRRERQRYFQIKVGDRVSRKRRRTKSSESPTAVPPGRGGTV